MNVHNVIQIIIIELVGDNFYEVDYTFDHPCFNFIPLLFLLLGIQYAITYTH